MDGMGKIGKAYRKGTIQCRMQVIDGAISSKRMGDSVLIGTVSIMCRQV